MRYYLVILFIFTFALCWGKTNWVNIRDFGAIGNGRSDDTEAFQKAIAYCTQNSNASILIPTGKYLVNQQLAIKQDIQVKGEHNSEVIVGNKVRNNLFWIYGNILRISFKNLRFNNRKSEQLGELLRFEGCENIEISDCYFDGQLTTYFIESKNVMLKNNVYMGLAEKPGAQIYFKHTTNIQVLNNTFNSSGGIIFVDRCSRIKVQKNYFYNLSGYPIHFDGGVEQKHSKVLIDNNQLIGSGAVAMQGGTYDQVSCFTVEQLQISNNRISQSGDMGITLAHCREVYVFSNIIYKSNVSAISLIDAHNCIIENNRMENNGIRPIDEGIDPKARAGVYIYGDKSYSTDSVLLKGNTISFSGNKGKVYPLSVTAPANSKHRFFLYDSKRHPTTGGYTEVSITSNTYTLWKRSMLSKIKF